MILNNQVAENFQHILKQIYLDPRTKYVKRKGKRGAEIRWPWRSPATKPIPTLWYILGIDRFRLASGCITIISKFLKSTASIWPRGRGNPDRRVYTVVNKVFTSPPGIKKKSRVAKPASAQFLSVTKIMTSDDGGWGLKRWGVLTGAVTGFTVSTSRK